MAMTEQLFHDFADIARKFHQEPVLNDTSDLSFTGPFATLEFVPALEQAIRDYNKDWTFPDLEDTNARQVLLQAYDHLPFPPPNTKSLPKILDALAGHLLEPQCQQPTFIIHHPECMSPLAKSFIWSPQGPDGIAHRISARAELFIRGREYVNCYEEENSPLEQRRKFEAQLQHRDARDGAETHGEVDESYLSALEYGMPPTGGWGCGVDRIVMLFSGKSRIADVLPFGTLRNVVALGNARTRVKHSNE